MLRKLSGFFMAGVIGCLFVGTANAGPDASTTSPAVVNNPTPVADPCPSGMTHVEGEYCTEVKEECAVWKDVPCEIKQAKGCRPLVTARCQTFKPSVCVGEKVHKDFCIDVTEYTKPGETLPMNHATWTDGTRICKEEGKRMCKESEWNFACEGEEMLPYSTGLERPSRDVCNIDTPPEILGPVNNRTDYRKSSEDLKQCISPFGVIAMNGNLDEFVDRETSWGPYKDLLKGGHWMPIRARCRPSTNAHNETFGTVYTGFRCCKDSQ